MHKQEHLPSQDIWGILKLCRMVGPRARLKPLSSRLSRKEIKTCQAHQQDQSSFTDTGIQSLYKGRMGKEGLRLYSHIQKWDSNPCSWTFGLVIIYNNAISLVENRLYWLSKSFCPFNHLPYSFPVRQNPTFFF